jgi:hypothetical protein
MMEILIRPRQSGKSSFIAQQMKLNRNTICVQPTESMKRYFSEKFKIPLKRVITFYEFIYSSKGKKRYGGVYIDEIGIGLEVITGQQIILGTHT